MITVDEKNLRKRLDVFLSEYLLSEGYKIFSRSFLKENWENLIKVNDRDLKPSYKLKEGDRVEIDMQKINELAEGINNSVGIEGQDGELDILFEDSNFLVINKVKGMVVHPGIGNKENTLANIVRGYLERKDEFDKGVDRAGIVHRLDKAVSGLIVFAKTVTSQRFLQKQFEEHSVKKTYLAEVEYNGIATVPEVVIPEDDLDIKEEIEKLVKNDFKCDDSWYKAEGYIKRSNRSRVKMSFQVYKSGNAKYALSYIKPIGKDKLLIMIETGRMHQIRATLEYLGIKIKGDTLYGSTKGTEMPDAIELTSILLSFKNMDNKNITLSKI